MTRHGESFQLISSLKIQGRVIFALLMREIITRFGRHNIGFLWLLGEPMLFTVGVTTLWTLSKATHGSHLDIISFAITGYSSVLLWRNCANRCALAIAPNLTLLFHRNVKIIDILLSRILLEIAGATTSFVALLLVCIFFGLIDYPSDILMMMFGWVLLSMFSAGLGMVVGMISERGEMFERFWHIVTYLTFPMSGAVFMVDWLPARAREVVLYFPMVHGVEIIRSGYYGDKVVSHYSFAYLAIFSLVLILIGLILVEDTKKKVGSF